MWREDRRQECLEDEHDQVQTQRRDERFAPAGHVICRQPSGLGEHHLQGARELAVEVKYLVNDMCQQEAAQVEIV